MYVSSNISFLYAVCFTIQYPCVFPVNSYRFMPVIMDVEGYFPHYPYNRNCTVDLVCHYMCSCAGVNYINICKVTS